MPDEVVTRAPVRYVDPARRRRHARADHAGQRLRPHQADHVRPARAVQPGDRPRPGGGPGAEAGEIVGVGVTGKPFIFAVGADLGRSARTTPTRAGAGHRPSSGTTSSAGSASSPSRRSRSSTAPPWAAGSSWPCTAATARSPRAPPLWRCRRCFLGLVPGLGRHLPAAEPDRRPDKALEVIIENALNQNRMLKGPQAFKLGIADAMFEPADFLEQSLVWAADGARPARSSSSGRRSTAARRAWDAATARPGGQVDAKTARGGPRRRTARST